MILGVEIYRFAGKNKIGEKNKAGPGMALLCHFIPNRQAAGLAVNDGLLTEIFRS
jgi:hypothetical protein